MRKTSKTLLLLIMTAALLAATFSVGMAKETGKKEPTRQEEAKKQKQKTKKQKSTSKRKGSSEDKIISDVNRAGRNVMDAINDGAEALRTGLNEEYSKLRKE